MRGRRKIPAAGCRCWGGSEVPGSQSFWMSLKLSSAWLLLNFSQEPWDSECPTGRKRGSLPSWLGWLEPEFVSFCDVYPKISFIYSCCLRKQIEKKYCVLWHSLPSGCSLLSSAASVLGCDPWTPYQLLALGLLGPSGCREQNPAFSDSPLDSLDEPLAHWASIHGSKRNLSRSRKTY